MAVLRVHYLVLYLPPKDNSGNDQPHWYAYHFCMGTKYGELRPKSRTKLFGDDGKIVTVGAHNAHLCRKAFGKWLSTLARDHCGGEATVIAVPSKDALKDGGCGSRAYTMVEQACAEQANIHPLDAVRFTKVMAKASSQQGTRNPQELYDAMEVIAKPTRGVKYILVDDIYTLGGHMKAALKRLEEAGFNIEIGAVCGMTVQDATGKAGSSGVFEMDKAFFPEFTAINWDEF